jgi:S-adenosylmethionine:tRNA ribosyltransferase-isomerase
MTITLKNYDYKLPEEKIAQIAHVPRDECKLMVVGETISNQIFSEIKNVFGTGDVLVLNNTKVLNAKIYGKKNTGSAAEIVLTKKISENNYECKIKTKNPHIGTIITLDKGFAKIIGQKNIDTYTVKLSGHPKKYLPGPPYIHKKMGEEYQTIYAKNPGSLASPTAGLHFTKKLLTDIKKRGVKIVYVTLHVGYGTFRNIENIEKHIMEEEFFEIPKKTAEIINTRKGKLFVVGTTTLKTLESSSKHEKIIPKSGGSKLFIKPGHKFSSGTDVLITNFHLPKSTLLLLTCAFGGTKRILDAYNVAVIENYRFYSLGDAMLIFK